LKNIVEILPWDSNFLGFSTAKVETEKITFNQLNSIIEELKTAKIKLTYFIADANDHEALNSLSNLIAPIDVKQFLEINLSNKQFQTAQEISVVNESKPNAALYALAQTAGSFSRFKRDPNFPPQTFEKLYNIWIENELNDKQHCTVFTFNEKQRPIGIITLKQKNEKGIISLVAVNENSQGKGIGKKLIKHALAHLKSIGCSTCVVASQKLNNGAISFYKKIGFTLVEEQVYFHLWL
jgi:dTDP-4-amino-4,6-dideoxy-D-galactose acyltransferase